MSRSDDVERRAAAVARAYRATLAVADDPDGLLGWLVSAEGAWSRGRIPRMPCRPSSVVRKAASASWQGGDSPGGRGPRPNLTRSRRTLPARQCPEHERSGGWRGTQG
jgi:hypothetical protein